LKTNYGDPRRTQIVQPSTRKGKRGPVTAKDLDIAKDTWVVLTEKGLISRTPTARLPRISGRSAPRLVIGAGGRDQLFLFSARGKGISIPLHVIPETSSANEGVPIRSVSAFNEAGQIVAGIALPKNVRSDEKLKAFLLFGTSQGMVKKTAVSLLPGTSAKAFTAIKISKGDSLGWVTLTMGKDEVLLASRSGMAIRFSESDVRSMGLAAGGVQGMKLAGKDERIVLMSVVNTKKDLFLISDQGVAKRTKLGDFPKQGRYGKGVLAWKSGEQVQLVGGGVGSGDHRGSARFKKSPPRSVRFDDAVRRGRASAGKALFELESGNLVTQFTPVTNRPVIPAQTKKSPKPSTAKASKSKGKRTAKKSAKQGTRAKSSKRGLGTTKKPAGTKKKAAPKSKTANSSRSKKKRSSK
jgi:DNA gyrase/topoisomerase IV subunit A